MPITAEDLEREFQEEQTAKNALKARSESKLQEGISVVHQCRWVLAGGVLGALIVLLSPLQPIRFQTSEDLKSLSSSEASQLTLPKSEVPEFAIVIDCVGDRGMNCENVCSDRGSTCNAQVMKTLTTVSKAGEAFQRAGVPCHKPVAENEDNEWDGPNVDPAGSCHVNTNEHAAKVFPPTCNANTRCGWMRLCACMRTGKEAPGARHFAEYFVNVPDATPPSAYPARLTKKGTESEQSEDYLNRMAKTDVQGEPYKTPAEVTEFVTTFHDRAPMLAFYARLGKWGVQSWPSGFSALSIGARYYNQRMKEMFFDLALRQDGRYKYYQLDPKADVAAEEGTDGTFHCLVQDAPQLYPDYKDFVEVILDWGVLGWGPVFDLVDKLGADPQGVENYLEGIAFLLKPGGVYILVTSCNEFCGKHERDPTKTSRVLKTNFAILPRFLGFTHGADTTFNAQVHIYRKRS